MSTRGSALGAYVRERRKKLGLTQEQLAEAADLEQTWISQVETGRIVEPSRGMIERLARGLRCSVDDIYRAAGFISAPWEEDASATDFKRMIDEFFGEHPELTDIVERVRRKLNDEAKFQRWRRNTYEAWISNLRMSANQVMLDEAT